MAEIKTKVNDASVIDFINSVEDEQKRKDSLQLLSIFEELTGETAKMWGTSIIGFGKYHYKSERSCQEGDWPLTGFSPRKQNLTLYVMPGLGVIDEQLMRLGKHTTSKGCLYIKRLADINLNVLREIIKASFDDARSRYL